MFYCNSSSAKHRALRQRKQAEYATNRKRHQQFSAYGSGIAGKPPHLRLNIRAFIGSIDSAYADLAMTFPNTDSPHYRRVRIEGRMVSIAPRSLAEPQKPPEIASVATFVSRQSHDLLSPQAVTFALHDDTHVV